MTENLEKKCGIEFNGTKWCNHLNWDCPYVNQAKYLMVRYYNRTKRTDVQELYRECTKRD